MDAGKIRRLRAIAGTLKIRDYPLMAVDIAEAADELERLGRIEAAAMSFISAPDHVEAWRFRGKLEDLLKASPCPPK